MGSVCSLQPVPGRWRLKSYSTVRAPQRHRVDGETQLRLPENTLFGLRKPFQVADNLGVSGLQEGEVGFCREEK